MTDNLEIHSGESTLPGDYRIARLPQELWGSAYLLLAENPDLDAENLEQKARAMEAESTRRIRNAQGGDTVNGVVMDVQSGIGSLDAQGSMEFEATIWNPELAREVEEKNEECARNFRLNMAEFTRIKSGLPKTVQRGLEFYFLNKYGNLTYDEISQKYQVPRGSISTAIKRAKPAFAQLALKAQASHTTVSEGGISEPEIQRIHQVATSADSALESLIPNGDRDLIEEFDDLESLRWATVHRLIERLPEKLQDQVGILQLKAIVCWRLDQDFDRADELLRTASGFVSSLEQAARIWNEMGQVADARGDQSGHLKRALMAHEADPSEPMYVLEVLVAALQLGNAFAIEGATSKVLELLTKDAVKSTAVITDKDREYLVDRLINNPRLEGLRSSGRWGQIKKHINPTDSSNPSNSTGVA